MANTQYKKITGTGQATNASADTTIIAAQGAATKLRITNAIVTVSSAAAGGGGLVKLEDGASGTAFFTADADTEGVYQLNFGSGYTLTTNTLLNLAVDSAATTQATANATVVAEVLGA